MIKLLVAVLLLVVSQATVARNTQLMLSYQDAMATADAKEKLAGDIQFFFGDQKHPSVVNKKGEFTSNKKTNAFNKTDPEACQWAFLSAMIALKDRAMKEGGNAVINIHSYYKKNLVESTTEFECGAGAFIAGVTLKGTVVTLK